MGSQKQVTWTREENELLISNIKFNGKERTDVEEYCISEGWIRVAVGKALDRRGKPLTLQYRGTVEPYFKD